MEARRRAPAPLPLRRGLAGLTPEAARELLAWGERNRRELPWRTTRDPWAVLVSEVMLQQTQAARVVPAWTGFMARFPDPSTCASAPLAEVLRRWQGLGYMRRARDLHRTACIVVTEHGGRLPERLDDLLALPGIGPYTARAVLVFAHEQRHGVVDTNVGRLLARWDGRPLTAGRAQARADELVPAGRSWDWNQSLFDLAAAICRPRSPRCDACPVRTACAWGAAGRPEPDPAAGSARTGRRQAPFDGSDRQLRGRLVAALCEAPFARAGAGALLGVPPARADRVVAGLLDDGLVAEVDGQLDLPR